jgi:Protein kinase domain
MTTFHRVRELFESLVDAPTEEVDRRLTEEALDPSVRAEVRSLLDHHARAGAFLEQPVDASPLAETSLESGRRVGSYVVERELGSGGMGRVYLAHDERLGRAVCLKVVHNDLATNPTSRERLRQEARLAASLNHPGICGVYALEELDGDLFIVSEFVDGMTLREEMAHRQPASAEHVGALVAELCRALTAAHDAGIVHRDLKPDNIMRARDGRLKILDFGLARRENDEARSRVPATLPGLAVGTLAYMAPEQVNGAHLDRRVDLFALGVLAYEYATGTHPFAAPTPMATVARILNDEPEALGVRRPDLPAGVANAVMRCLRKARDERPATAHDVEALIGDRRGQQPTPAGNARAWWRFHQGVVVLLYAAAAVSAWQVKEWDPSVLSRGAFLLIGLFASVGGCVRGHLLFVERMHGRGLEAERTRVAPVLRGIDVGMAVTLLLAAGSTSTLRPVASVFVMGLAAGLATAAVLIEPATTTAAFGRASSSAMS